MVSYLTEELVRLGHDVTLFASGDERVRSRALEFDVLHFHVEHVHLPLFRPFARKSVATLHGRLDHPDLAPLSLEPQGADTRLIYQVRIVARPPKRK